jgi:sortase (surface protein transpeptidase)
VVRAVRAVIDGIVAAWRAVVAGVRAVVRAVVGAVVAAWRAVVAGVRAVIRAVVGAIVAVARAVVRTAVSAVRAVREGAIRAWRAAVRGVRTTVRVSVLPFWFVARMPVRLVSATSLGLQGLYDRRVEARARRAEQRRMISRTTDQRRLKRQRRVPVPRGGGAGVLTGSPSRRSRTKVPKSVRVGGLVAVGLLAVGQALSVGLGAPLFDAFAATPAPRTVAVEIPEASEVPDPSDAPEIEEDAPAPIEEPGPESRRALPVLLRIPVIEVDTPVVIVGLEDDGAMEIPSDVRTVGWYEPFEGGGVTPGAAGTAVIAGHVDSRVQGRGAFWLLRDLRAGDLVEIVHDDDSVTVWRVDAVIRYPKDAIPIGEIFTFSGPSRLALITCGGEFDRSIGSYLDNYVVTATPVMVPGGATTLPTGPLS